MTNCSNVIMVRHLFADRGDTFMGQQVAHLLTVPHMHL